MKVRVRPDDIVDLDETEPTKKAKDLLEKAPYKQLTPSDYCVVHDYLMVSVLQHIIRGWVFHAVQA